jgi:hypothetical protein
MPLCKANQGKYLTQQWHREREEVRYNGTEFFDTERNDWLESSNIENAGRDRADKWEVETQPISPRPDSSETRLVDLRKIKDPTFEDYEVK